MLELWPIFWGLRPFDFSSYHILSKFRPFSLPIQSWFKLPDYTLVEEKLGGTGAQPAEDVPKHQLGSGICFVVSRVSRPNFGRPPLEVGKGCLGAIGMAHAGIALELRRDTCGQHRAGWAQHVRGCHRLILADLPTLIVGRNTWHGNGVIA